MFYALIQKNCIHYCIQLYSTTVSTYLEECCTVLTQNSKPTKDKATPFHLNNYSILIKNSNSYSIMMIFLREFSSLMVIIVSLITIHTANLLSPISASASEIKTTIFRQSFWVENNEVFNDFEIEEFQTIYNGSTFQFAPNNEASKTVTNCSVFHQQMSVPEEKEEDEDEDDEDQTNFRLDIDFTMRYESIYHEVEDYPRMFQNWTNQNLETIRYKLNVLNLDVSDLGKALRIVVSTTAPAPAPSVPAVPVVRN